jgi:splicing factor 3B subunit 3
MIFVCSATHKTKSMFFFLAQTEQGDIFKITLETDEDMVSRPWIEECLFAVIYSYF